MPEGGNEQPVRYEIGGLDGDPVAGHPFGADFDAPGPLIGGVHLEMRPNDADGQAALEKILEAGQDEVVAGYAAPDKEVRLVDPIKQAALDHNLPIYQPANFKDEAVLDEMRALNADVMVMAYVIIFVPEAARDIPKMGSICFHPSLLPLHRGPSAINWSIIWGETKTGFCWFYPTDGLDEGEILLVEEKSELMTRMGRKSLRIELTEPLKAVPEGVEEYHLELAPDGRALTYTYDTNAERTGITRLLQKLSERGVALRDLQTKQSSLEEIFVSLVKEEDAA